MLRKLELWFNADVEECLGEEGWQAFTKSVESASEELCEVSILRGPGEHADDNPPGGYSDVHMRNASVSAQPSRTHSLPSVGGDFPEMISPEEGMNVDVTLRPNSDWFDIDLIPGLNDFAIDQCELAAHYRTNADRDASEGKGSEGIRKQRATSTLLLRTALRKCCYGSTLRALCDLADCYASGVGVAHEDDTSSALRYCVRILERVYEAKRMWEQLLRERSSFLRELKPEKQVIRMISISGPRKRLLGEGDGYIESQVPVIVEVCLQAARNSRATQMFNTFLMREPRDEGIANMVSAALTLLRRAVGRHDAIAIQGLVLHSGHKQDRHMLLTAKQLQLSVSKNRVETVTRRLNEAVRAAIRVSHDIMHEDRQLITISDTPMQHFIVRKLISEILKEPQSSYSGIDQDVLCASDTSSYLIVRVQGLQSAKWGRRVLFSTSLLPNKMRFGTKVKDRVRKGSIIVSRITLRVAEFMGKIMDKSKTPMLLEPTAKSYYPIAVNFTLLGQLPLSSVLPIEEIDVSSHLGKEQSKKTHVTS